MKHIVTIVLLFSVFQVCSQDINQMDAQGKRHGVWKKNFEGTEVVRYEGKFEHGKEVGLFKFYKYIDKKGVLSATKQFNKDGSAEVKFFASNGKVISQGKMIGRTYVGKWIYYHNKSDVVMIEETFNSKGELEGERKVFYPNGQLAEMQHYKNGKLDGVSKMYAQNDGKLINEYTYVNGELHGPAKSYDDSGQIVAEGNYRHDKQHGIWKFYENGQLKEEKDFTVYSKNPYLKKE